MNWARQRPLITFFVLAFAFTWALLPVAHLSIAVSLVALLGPAVAAFLTAGLSGSAAWQDLRARVALWRVPVIWYLLALLLPVAISLLRTGIEQLAGVEGPVTFQPVTTLSPIVFVLVAGEEIGWRGFALPRLLGRLGPWGASAMLGVLWALWHLPLFYMAGMPQYGTPFMSYVPYLVALSVILTALVERTRGSVITATVFHGAVNTFGVTTTATASQRGWSNAVSYGAVAILVGVIAWRSRARRRAK
jgi:membrane protease YdiL (CAAX protease family)